MLEWVLFGERRLLSVCECVWVNTFELERHSPPVVLHRVTGSPWNKCANDCVIYIFPVPLRTLCCKVSGSSNWFGACYIVKDSLEPWALCTHFLSVGTTGVCGHTWLMQCEERTPGISVCCTALDRLSPRFNFVCIFSEFMTHIARWAFRVYKTPCLFLTVSV